VDRRKKHEKGKEKENEEGKTGNPYKGAERRQQTNNQTDQAVTCTTLEVLGEQFTGCAALIRIRWEVYGHGFCDLPSCKPDLIRWLTYKPRLPGAHGWKEVFINEFVHPR